MDTPQPKIIDKISWVYIVDERVLMAKPWGKDIYYNPGGKRKPGESDEDALIREIMEEARVTILRPTIRFMTTLEGQADGQPEGVNVRHTCYWGEYQGIIKPGREIEKFKLFTSRDGHLTTITGRMYLDYLKNQNLIG